MLYPITLFNRESESRRARGLYVEPRGGRSPIFIMGVASGLGFGFRLPPGGPFTTGPRPRHSRSSPGPPHGHSSHAPPDVMDALQVPRCPPTALCGADALL